MVEEILRYAQNDNLTQISRKLGTTETVLSPIRAARVNVDRTA